MDLWQQVRELWGAGADKVTSNRPAKVDYDGLIAEIKSSLNRNRHKIGDTVFVPCDYLVQISPKDVVDILLVPMQMALQKTIENHIREHNYTVQGAITVRLSEDEALEQGHVQVTASHTPSTSTPATAASAPMMGNDTERTVMHPPFGAPQVGAPQATFEIVKGDATQRGKRLELKTFPATLGRITRSQNPSLGVLDPTNNVGREHAFIEHRNGVFSIRDNSQNGTWVNGVRLKKDEKTVLVDGAEINLANGVVVLRFQLQNGERTIMQPGKGTV